MKFTLFALSVLSLGLNAQDAKSILDATATKGGFVVHLGSGDGTLTEGFRVNDSIVVHGLDNDQARIDKARSALLKKGVYGPVALEKLATPTLPYVDNMVNLIVVDDALGVTENEIQRVLTPGGAVYRKKDGKITRKERPSDMDDWTHYLHSPDGNPVAKDNYVGPPEALQWVGSPRWSRHHDRMSSLSAMVSAKGRMFYIMDEGSRISIVLPPKWRLIARDAFNGVVLWKRDLADWQNHMWPLKSGPTQLTRRLVAVGDDVFATLAFKAPVTQFDAATGETKRVFEQSKACEEILVEGGTLFTLSNQTGKHELDDYKYENQKEVERYTWDEQPRDIMAFDIASGKLLWTLNTACAPLSMCVSEKGLFFHNGKSLVALDRTNGKPMWESELAKRKAAIQFNFGPRLIAYQSVVIFAGGEGEMAGYDQMSGKKLWTAPHAKSGYQSPHDLLIAKNQVWNAPNTGTGDTGILTGRDPLTGEVKTEFPPTVDTYWFHHRCYISKATENFMLMSRTGVEFIDFTGKKWDINHWVRGACLYGVMPANGITYAPPHNCACYPETKLYGINALIPASKNLPKPSLADSDEGRMEKGPAYEDSFDEYDEPGQADWPTYRSTEGRTGYLNSPVTANGLAPKWEIKLDGKLTSTTIAEGKVFVVQVDRHTLHAINAATGKPSWHYTTGGRIDSPPSVWKGRVVFGSADGWVYCLKAKDGELVWRFRGAPRWERHMAFEGLESVWPVHGAVLVEDGVANFVAGRSNFLNGGLRFTKVDISSGSKLVETSVDDRDPETGGDIQDKLQTLQMPTGLADILVSDGKFTYLKSQKFSADGQRPEIGVTSGNAIAHGANQQGEGAHVYAPMGFLDDTWFHRSYWVYGKNFAGGHNGYYQAGKFTPSGRILCVDDKNVYSFARKPQYYKWTTPLEHHLFSAPKEAPQVSQELLTKALTAGNPRKKAKAGAKGKGKATEAAVGEIAAISFANNPSLDPTNKPLTVEAWIKTDLRGGTIVAHGGTRMGYALTLREGKPSFAVKTTEKGAISAVTAAEPIDNGWHHLAGVLAEDKSLKIYVDGKLGASATALGFMTAAPRDGLDIAADGGSKLISDVSEFAGSIDAIAISHTAATPEQLAARARTPGKGIGAEAKPALVLTFDQSSGADASGNRNNGQLAVQSFVPGMNDKGMALRLATDAPKAGPGSEVQMPANGYFVDPQWTKDVPIIARGMAVAQKTIFVAGPEDVVDEEDAVVRMGKGDETILPLVQKMDDNLEGKNGGLLLAVNTEDGAVVSTLKLDSPPAWDGLTVAQGCVFMSTLDGRVICFQGKP
ncbi:MAG: PQQ-binding-like beta-propeller repeat protein [Verrucomicrobiaceae bacterium]|nr:PQQ-binding-like beta-propeller repeat protein [Verrucomicrobiaceae bacterium]